MFGEFDQSLHFRTPYKMRIHGNDMKRVRSFSQPMSYYDDDLEKLENKVCSDDINRGSSYVPSPSGVSR